ncbi:Glycine cleavage system H protein (lipoate-binding) [Desulfocicer vacuolatum DSM 3385]|uniref:Glycine cleavage system H protein (Lipoate-binding) n=1 Tax=Desulfocicer vacuolatum DSM 3385 TaxID=1121400 RepID=A0A1W2CK17_9BACT|nr:glycine cleavage system protein H [Desulfocicer vacuolatum]SMC85553.1 Glycine cleavage system H protein (lipoate-binding) [Desulfocicer vacuolatum DSM 3385]
MKTHTIKNKTKQAPMVFDMTSNQCVWSRAGIMSPFPCMNAFNCFDCPLDKKMQERVQSKQMHRHPAWRNHLPHTSEPVITGTDTKCRHMLSGRVAYKYCIHNYDCATCAYHQLMEEETISLAVSHVNKEYAGGFSLAQRYYYHRGHTWARIEYGGRVRLGLDDFATKLLGPMDLPDLPALGTAVQQGEPGIGIARDELKAEALYPMEGIVVAINPTIRQKGMVNKDPYGEGWLMIIEPTKLKMNLKNLIFGEESIAWMEEESSRLAALVSQETEYKLAATGGRAVNDIYGQIPELGWDTLVKSFLLTP